MDGRDPARMAGVPRLEEVQGLAAPHLADDDAVGAQSHGRPDERLEADAGRGPQGDDIFRVAIKLARIFEDEDPLGFPSDLGEEGIRERRLARRRAARDQDVLAARER